MSSSRATTTQPDRSILQRLRDRLRRLGLALTLVISTSLVLVTVWFTISPTPSILLLRNAFRQQELTTPSGYDALQRKVTVVRNLTYPSRYGRNTFDLYEPTGWTSSTSSALPVIVWAHGGGFIAGDKSSMTTYATMMASRGYAVVAMNYDYAPDGQYPAPVIQMGEMVSHLTSIASQYGLDTASIIVGGDSAGAQIAAQFAVVNTTSGYSQSTGIATRSLRTPLKGVILFCGPYDLASSATENSSVVKKWFINTIGWGYLGRRDWKDSSELNDATIVNHLSADFPTTYIMDGNFVSFPEQGRTMVKRLTALGVNVTSRFFPNDPSLPHEFQFDFAYPESTTVWNDVSSFLDTLEQER